MTLPRPALSPVCSMLLRLAMLIALLAAPLLAMPVRGAAHEGTIVGIESNRGSGAGLVIVVGLRRAR